jgi:hypothetical protein
VPRSVQLSHLTVTSTQLAVAAALLVVLIALVVTLVMVHRSGANARRRRERTGAALAATTLAPFPPTEPTPLPTPAPPPRPPFPTHGERTEPVPTAEREPADPPRGSAQREPGYNEPARNIVQHRDPDPDAPDREATSPGPRSQEHELTDTTEPTGEHEPTDTTEPTGEHEPRGGYEPMGGHEPVPPEREPAEQAPVTPGPAASGNGRHVPPTPARPPAPGVPTPSADGADGAAASGARPHPAERGTGGTDPKDRLLRVLLLDPDRALRAVTDLEASKAQLERLTESVHYQRRQLADAARRLRRAGLTPAQVAQLAGFGEGELVSLLVEHPPSPTRRSLDDAPRGS